MTVSVIVNSSSSAVFETRVSLLHHFLGGGAAVARSIVGGRAAGVCSVFGGGAAGVCSIFGGGASVCSVFGGGAASTCSISGGEAAGACSMFGSGASVCSVFGGAAASVCSIKSSVCSISRVCSIKCWASCRTGFKDEELVSTAVFKFAGGFDTVAYENLRRRAFCNSLALSTAQRKSVTTLLPAIKMALPSLSFLVASCKISRSNETQAQAPRIKLQVNITAPLRFRKACSFLFSDRTRSQAASPSRTRCDHDDRFLFHPAAHLHRACRRPYR